jgi:hypothetical protein
MLSHWKEKALVTPFGWNIKAESEDSARGPASAAKPRPAGASRWGNAQAVTSNLNDLNLRLGFPHTGRCIQPLEQNNESSVPGPDTRWRAASDSAEGCIRLGLGLSGGDHCTGSDDLATFHSGGLHPIRTRTQRRRSRYGSRWPCSFSRLVIYRIQDTEHRAGESASRPHP